MPRSSKPAPPPSSRPWATTIVAVDPASTSGWSIWAHGGYVDSGEVGLSIRAIDGVLVRAVGSMAACIGPSAPAVLVLERPFAVVKGRAFGSQGKGRELWRACWEAHGGAKCRVIQVYPAAWRARVLGGGAHAAKRERVRKLEAAAAKATTGYDCGGDEAAAVLIGKWATHAGEVGAALPAKQRRTV